MTSLDPEDIKNLRQEQQGLTYVPAEQDTVALFAERQRQRAIRVRQQRLRAGWCRRRDPETAA